VRRVTDVHDPRAYVAPSRIDGRGCFAGASYQRGQKVAELAGARISRREARRRMAGKQRIRICDLDERVSIDASDGGDATAFINHSCQPNVFMRVTRGHALLFALAPIRAGDELLLDYGLSHHDGTKRCRCGADRCRGAI
jgi:SET domain-containing protein